MKQSLQESSENPLFETLNPYQGACGCIMVIFGATGDLSARKLIPALYNLSKEGYLPAHFACVGFARRAKTHALFREEMRQAVEKFSRSSLDEETWAHFSESLYYHQGEFHEEKAYATLKKFLEELDQKYETRGNRLYYLSVPSSSFTEICTQLSRHELVYPEEEANRYSRVIIEKPFGHNLPSAVELNTQLRKGLNENQIYRIDHWLGKETVQNLMVLRFSNPIFESLWNAHHIDHVQITVAEDIGIGSRGNLFEESGMVRDVMQNHMMQLLSLVAMEPPSSLSPEAIRDEKVKVLKSLRPFTPKTLASDVVRGQYQRGWIQGKDAIGYREENNVSPTSYVETYCAFKCFIDNWRWSGVPFYLRAGKRLPKRITEIAITFKSPPPILFTKQVENNVLVIRIQPDEGLSLKINCKLPGFTAPLHPVLMDFRYNQQFNATPPEAYELLILNAMSEKEDNTLFARIDEVLASWKFFDPLLSIESSSEPSFYPCGSWGPVEADHIIKEDNRQWRLL